MISMIKKNSMFCGSTKVGSRGQIVIPQEIREKLDIREGEVLVVIEKDAKIEIFKSETLKKALDGIM